MERFARIVGVWIVTGLLGGAVLVIANNPPASGEWTSDSQALRAIGYVVLGLVAVSLAIEAVLLVLLCRRNRWINRLLPVRLVVTNAVPDRTDFHLGIPAIDDQGRRILRDAITTMNWFVWIDVKNVTNCVQNDVRAYLTFRRETGEDVFRRLTARWREMPMPYQVDDATGISDVVRIFPEQISQLDAAWTASSGQTYALNTDSMRTVRSWEDPTRFLSPGRYKVDVLATAKHKRDARAVFELIVLAQSLEVRGFSAPPRQWWKRWRH